MKFGLLNSRFSCDMVQMLGAYLKVSLDRNVVQPPGTVPGSVSGVSILLRAAGQVQLPYDHGRSCTAGAPPQRTPQAKGTGEGIPSALGPAQLLLDTLCSHLLGSQPGCPQLGSILS